jgi:hypothetical protein
MLKCTGAGRAKPCMHPLLSYVLCHQGLGQGHLSLHIQIPFITPPHTGSLYSRSRGLPKLHRSVIIQNLGKYKASKNSLHHHYWEAPSFSLWREEGLLSAVLLLITFTTRVINSEWVILDARFFTTNHHKSNRHSLHFFFAQTKKLRSRLKYCIKHTVTECWVNGCSAL